MKLIALSIILSALSCVFAVIDHDAILPNITFTSLFDSEYKDNIFPVEKKITLFIGFENVGQLKQKIFGVSGYLGSKKNSSFVLRNVTAYGYDVSVEAGDQATIPFYFTPYGESIDSVLVVLLDMVDADGSKHRLVAFEGPATFKSTASLFDIQSLVMYIVSGYALYRIVMSSIKKDEKVKVITKKNKRDAEKRDQVVATAEEMQADWIPDHVLQHAKNRRK